LLNLPEDAEDLIDFRVSLEKGPLVHHLSKDAGNRPNIHRARVSLASEKDFWSPIPEGHYLMSVSAQRHSEGTSQTKIGNFDYSTIVADQQVLRFQVPVQHSSFVAEQHGNHNLQN
jgi:hypothetical protein